MDIQPAEVGPVDVENGAFSADAARIHGDHRTQSAVHKHLVRLARHRTVDGDRSVRVERQDLEAVATASLVDRDRPVTLGEGDPVVPASQQNGCRALAGPTDPVQQADADVVGLPQHHLKARLDGGEVECGPGQVHTADVVLAESLREDQFHARARVDGVPPPAGVDDIRTAAAGDVVLTLATDEVVAQRAADDRVETLAAIDVVEPLAADEDVSPKSALQVGGRQDARAVDDVITRPGDANHLVHMVVHLWLRIARRVHILRLARLVVQLHAERLVPGHASQVADLEMLVRHLSGLASPSRGGPHIQVQRSETGRLFGGRGGVVLDVEQCEVAEILLPNLLPFEGQPQFQVGVGRNAALEVEIKQV